MTCQQAREESAVALLTREPPPASITAHINSCLSCNQEWHELVQLSPLLAATLDDSLPAVEPASRALLARLLTEVARRRRHRRIAAIVSAAAAVAIAVPVGLVLARGELGAAQQTSALGVTASPSNAGTTNLKDPAGPFAKGWAKESATGAEAAVAVDDTDAGTQVAVNLHGIPTGTKCEIVLVDHTGQREKVPEWWTISTKNAGTTHREQVKMDPRDIMMVQVVNHSTGKIMVTVPVQEA